MLERDGPHSVRHLVAALLACAMWLVALPLSAQSAPATAPATAPAPATRYHSSDPETVHSVFRVLGFEVTGSPRPSRPNRLALATVRLEGVWFRPVAKNLYLAPGLNLGVGASSGRRCTVPMTCEGSHCTCPTTTGEWNGVMARYGPSIGFVAKSGFGKPYSLIWMPKLRIEHVFTRIGNGNESCNQAYGSDGCSRWSWANLAATASLDFQFIHSAPVGCGLELGFTGFVGDLASRERTWWMLDLSFAWALAFSGPDTN